MTLRSPQPFLPPFVLVAALVLGFTSAASSQSGDAGSLAGTAQIGYRSVDVTGRQEKYREDINLSDGPRLFHFELDFSPSRGLRDVVDSVRIDAHNLGGDPFELFSLSVKKHGRYTLDYERRKSSYFYDDILLPPELASPSLDDDGDLHRFDFDRVQDRATLALRLTPAAKLTLAFDQYRKTGRRTTTLDLERDLFELEQPVDERMQEVLGGFEYAWRKVTLAFEERIRDYDNVVELTLPGQSPGATPDNDAVLDYLFLDRPYDLRSYSHTLRLLVHPDDRLTVRGAANVTDLELDLAARESSKGTTFQGQPFATDASGGGGVTRDLVLLDLDVSYLVSDRWSVFGGARRHELDQDGRVRIDEEDAAGGSLEGSGIWTIGTTSADAGLRWLAASGLTLSGGLRHERRDVTSAWVLEESAGGTEQETSTTGFFGTLGWRATDRFRLRTGYEDAAYDGPYTLASPTARRIFRLRAQYGGGQGLSASGSARLSRSRNGDSGWSADTDILNLRLGYRIAAFSASVGYSRLGMTRAIDQTVTTPPGFQGGEQFLMPVAYDVTVDSVDGRLIWSFADRWKLGGLVRLYQSDGSWAVERDDLRGWVEVLLGDRYVAHAGYRHVDYAEPVRGFNDYRAHIGELSIGYRW